MRNLYDGVFALGLLFGIIVSIALYLYLGENILSDMMSPPVVIPSLASAGSVLAAIWIYFQQRNADFYRSAEAIRLTIVPVSNACRKVVEKFDEASRRYQSGEAVLHPLLIVSAEFRSLPLLKMNNSDVTTLINVIDNELIGHLMSLDYNLDIAKNIFAQLFDAREEILAQNFVTPIPAIRGSFSADQEYVERANKRAANFEDEIVHLISVLNKISSATAAVNFAIWKVTGPDFSRRRKG